MDREKVIKSLKWFRDRDSWREGIMIHDDHAEVRKRICDNAISLLKEQEAHILTIEELWNAEVVWLEWRDKAQVKVVLPFIDAQDETYLFNGTVGSFEEIPCWYKHTWDAWSARPTEEQRRSVKWE